jgi:DNA-directed RNA polymerase subunit RPC12/RpoP
MALENHHLLLEYKCFMCSGKLSKIDNFNAALAVQLGLRSCDRRLALRPGFNDILKHHVQCEKCGLIICRSCQKINKTNIKWHNWPNCPKCGSKMVYV